MKLSLLIIFFLLHFSISFQVSRVFPGRNRRSYFGNSDKIDGTNDDQKRKPTGTCTCTCETKPIHNNQENSNHDNNNNRVWMRTKIHGNNFPPQQLEGRYNPWNENKENFFNDTSFFDHSQAQNLESQNNPPDSWGNESRFLWKNLPDKDCYRKKCETYKDCCQMWNVCDKSAKVCIDCWHGMACSSEADCCFRNPYCQKEKGAVTGKCVEMKKDKIYFSDSVVGI